MKCTDGVTEHLFSLLTLGRTSRNGSQRLLELAVCFEISILYNHYTHPLVYKRPSYFRPKSLQIYPFNAAKIGSAQLITNYRIPHPRFKNYLSTTVPKTSLFEEWFEQNMFGSLVIICQGADVNMTNFLTSSFLPGPFGF